MIPQQEPDRPSNEAQIGAHTALRPKKDYHENELAKGGKIVAGVLLVGLTNFCVLYLIGHWPDRLVEPRGSRKTLLHLSMVSCSPRRHSGYRGCQLCERHDGGSRQDR